MSFSDAIEKLNKIEWLDGRDSKFLGGVRQKVAFSDRLQYIKNIAQLKNLRIYAKLEELNKCKEEMEQFFCGFIAL